MIHLVSLCRCVAAMIEKTECCYVMGVTKGEAMFSLHSNYILFTINVHLLKYTVL